MLSFYGSIDVRITICLVYTMTVEQRIYPESIELEKPGHECGIALISTQTPGNLSDAVWNTSWDLANRGRHSSGASFWDENGLLIHYHKAEGSPIIVHQNLKHQWIEGNNAVVHTRYGTTGNTNLENIQPCHYADTGIYIAANGNNPHAVLLLNDLPPEYRSKIQLHHSDTYIMTVYVSYLLNCCKNLAQVDETIRIFARNPHIRECANNMIITVRGSNYVITDPYGFHPLFMGAYRDGILVASETTTFDVLDAYVQGPVPRGSVLKIQNGSCHTIDMDFSQQRAYCGLDANYMTDPEGLGPYNSEHTIGTSRFALGQTLGERFIETYPHIHDETNHTLLARQEQGYTIEKEPTIVVGVPASADMIAYGVSQSLNVPLVKALVKKKTAHKTFMNGDKTQIPELIRNKFDIDPRHIAGKRVILVDDSVVRGNTFRHIIEAIRQMGATEVYIISGFPQVHHTCEYGVAIDESDGLVANESDIYVSLGADGGIFAHMEELEMAYRASFNTFCRSCTQGIDPVDRITPTQ